MPMTLFLLPFMLSLFTIKAAASTLTTSRHYCSNSSTFTPNSTYHTNLNRVLHDLVSDAYGNKGFFFTSSEAVYGSFMCKDDVSKKECQECVKNVSLEITRVCHMTKVSVLWYHQCMLCYSDANSSATMEMKTWLDGYNEENIEKLDKFMKLLNKTMMVRAAGKAAQHPPRKHGHLNAKFTPEKKPRFWSSSKGKVHLPMIIFAAILAATIGLTLLFYKIVWHLLRGRRRRVLRRNSESRIEEDSIVRRQISELQSLQFHLQTIEAATNNFSDDNKLGEGGFGPVYKGTLPGGQEIAAKRLSRSSGQGVAEFKTEVELVAKLQHRNLVKLLGFSMERDETILVYENMPNRSLDRLLFDPELSGQLDWSARYKVILGVARGLLYLHEDSRLRIIHRDLKASNILLDADMNPKISDFGMARIFGTDQTQASTNIIVGTYGYMSPEYLMFGHFSVKSDVFSYGVFMLEIITGKKNNQFFALDSDEGLLGYIWKHWTNRTLSEVVEPALSSAYPMNEVIRCMHIGLLCVQDNMEDRPTMDAVILMLNGESISIPVPQRPSFFLPSKKYKLAPCVLNSDQSTSKVDHSNSKITPSWFASDSGSVDPGPCSRDF